MTTPELIALIVLVVPFLVSLATFLYRLAEARLPHNKAALLTTVAHTAVQAAEQSSLSGDEKKKMAEEVVSAALSSLGIKVDPLLVDASIESLVYALKNQPASVLEQQTPLIVSPPLVQQPLLTSLTQQEREPLVAYSVPPLVQQAQGTPEPPKGP